MTLRKIMAIIVLSLFIQLAVISGIRGGDVHVMIRTDSEPFYTIELWYQFSVPMVRDAGNFSTIHLTEANSYITRMGEPVIPVVVDSLELPWGSQIIDIQYTCSPMGEIQLSQKIISSSRPVFGDRNSGKVPREQDSVVYSSDLWFPSSWYTYRLSGGLNKDTNHTTFLMVQVNPVRYHPVTNTIQYVTSISIEITYEEPRTRVTFPDVYDLVIITCDRYDSFLPPLVAHKERYNVKTKLVTLSDIYEGVFFPVVGRDNPEKIKFFVKDAVESWGVTYVLLVGDFRTMPVRYTHLETDKGGTYEELEYLSDLYYADIYDGNGGFCSWDSNDNEVFGEWPDPGPMKDVVDLCPDVYIGRLACMYGFEVKTVVDKIITYEETTYGSNWFNTMVVCGGDTFDKSWEGGADYNEGEEATEKALEFMTGFNPVRLWASLDNLTTTNMVNTISAGAGFVYFCGHGNPKKWATHVNGDYENWTEDFGNRDMMTLSNKDMYPIVMVGGCHNSQFDVTPLNFLKNPVEAWIFSTYVLECWGWVFIKINGGGAIASIGSTGYGGVTIGDDNANGIADCVEGLDGWFETQFFRLYNEENLDVLGETYGQTVTDYVMNFPVYTDRYDCKIVETHVLFGDPSLKIGGYSS